MIHQDIQNKDILSHIFKFLDTIANKQDIFNLSFCNKRLNNILRPLINKVYSYIITNYNINNISTKYTSYKILPLITYNFYKDKAIEMLHSMLNNINEQVKLNTLEFFHVHNIFWYDGLSKALSILDDVRDNSHIKIITHILDYCDVDVKTIIVRNTNNKSMESFMDELADLEHVSISGNYNNCDTNYSTIKRFTTTAPSLYLLKNFQNITKLFIRGDKDLVNCSSSKFDWISNLTLPHLQNLYVNFDCDITLDTILKISPNLEELCVYWNDRCGTSYIQEYSMTREMSLISIIESIVQHMDFLEFDGCINISEILMASVVYKVLSNTVGKYPNIKCLSVLGFTQEQCNYWISNNSSNIMESYNDVCKPKSNNLQDILLYAYKMTCIYFVVIVAQEPSNTKVINFILSM